MLIAKDVVLGNSLDDGGIPVRRNPIVRLTGIQNNKKGCISFSDDDLSKHILNIGGTGAGKTNVIVEMTKQIKSQLTSRDVMIVFDTKNDFVELHGENDIVITNAMEERLKPGIAWNILWNWSRMVGIKRQ